MSEKKGKLVHLCPMRSLLMGQIVCIGFKLDYLGCIHLKNDGTCVSKKTAKIWEKRSHTEANNNFR